MIVYDGKYSWSGKKDSEIRPIAWWAGAYRLKIIDLSKSKTASAGAGVVMLKPIVVIVSDTGEGASVTNCAPELVKSVCRDFKLDIKKILWIEFHPGPPAHMNVGKFTRAAKIHDEALYTVDWRPARTGELEMIKPYSPEAEMILADSIS
jgi:hypothetical protein